MAAEEKERAYLPQEHELDVAKGLAQGYGNTQIGEQLGKSMNAINHVVRRLREKRHAPNNIELVLGLIDDNVLHLEDVLREQESWNKLPEIFGDEQQLLSWVVWNREMPSLVGNPQLVSIQRRLSKRFFGEELPFLAVVTAYYAAAREAKLKIPESSLEINYTDGVVGKHESSMPELATIVLPQKLEDKKEAIESLSLGNHAIFIDVIPAEEKGDAFAVHNPELLITGPDELRALLRQLGEMIPEHRKGLERIVEACLDFEGRMRRNGLMSEIDGFPDAQDGYMSVNVGDFLRRNGEETEIMTVRVHFVRNMRDLVHEKVVNAYKKKLEGEPRFVASRRAVSKSSTESV